MSELSLDDRLREVLDRLHIEKPTTLLWRARLFFDISKPNSHDTKPEFIADKKMAEKSVQKSEQLFQLVYSALTDEVGDHAQATTLTDFVDLKAKKKRKTTFVKTLVIWWEKMHLKLDCLCHLFCCSWIFRKD